MTDLYIACKAGSLRNGWELGGTLFHAVPVNSENPLCGQRPAIRWRSSSGAKVTCKKCLMRLQGISDPRFVDGVPQTVAF